MSSQLASGSLVTVTKSAVMKTLATPSIPSRPLPIGSSVSWPALKVAGPPTGRPTENFIAFGFGVGSAVTGMSAPSLAAGLGGPQVTGRPT